MSMNLYVDGTRTATVKVKGKRKTITDRTKFSLWQTPTEVTRQILSLVPAQQTEAYIEWAKSASEPYEDNVYDYEAMPDENWEYPVIDRVMVDPAEEHVAEFRDWLKMCDDEGYTVKFYTVWIIWG